MIPTPSFDGQAVDFDARAGLPEGVAEEAARLALELGGLRADELLLEVGAGTGQVGQHLRPQQSGQHRYLGFDLSAAMLERFVARDDQAELVVADGAGRWPVDDRSVRLVFGARVFHLLPPAHVGEELVRVASGRGVTLMAGKVERDRDSPHKWLRRGLHQRLKELGLRPRGGLRRMMEALAERGFVLAREEVASWTTHWAPARQLDTWADKPGLAGLALPEPQKNTLLAELRRAAQAQFGDLHRTHVCDHRYVLECARTPNFED